MTDTTVQLPQVNLSDFDIDQSLLAWPGVSLLIFTSVGCASCRFAKRELPQLDLPVERLCWIDAEENGGAVQRYQVFQLPAVFVIREGEFFGAVHARLTEPELNAALAAALLQPADELP